MNPKTRILRPGLKPNDFIRKVYFAFITGKSVFGLGFILLSAIFDVKFGLFLAPIFLASVPVYVWGLSRHKRALVLQDGLELDGRFVPFSTIRSVTTPNTQVISISYAYHGVELRSDLAFSPFQSIDVMQLAEELRAVAGKTGVPTSAGALTT